MARSYEGREVVGGRGAASGGPRSLKSKWRRSGWRGQDPSGAEGRAEAAASANVQIQPGPLILVRFFLAINGKVIRYCVDPGDFVN